MDLSGHYVTVYEEGVEVHSADGLTYIARGSRPRKSSRTFVTCWGVVIQGVHVASFFRREDARVFIRQKKFELSRYGRQEVA